MKTFTQVTDVARDPLFIFESIFTSVTNLRLTHPSYIQYLFLVENLFRIFLAFSHLDTSMHFLFEF